MENGSIAIASLQQADGIRKNRPVLILCEVPPYRDYLVCGISSQLRQAVKGVDVIIEANEEDFGQTHLQCSSVIRTRYLATLPSASIKGKLGILSRDKLTPVYESLNKLFIDLGQLAG